jgi:hypothetical protein
MIGFYKFRDRVNDYLSENFPGISLDTDIFEHALLYSLGYHFIPEKCQFGEEDENHLFVKLRTPYGVSAEQFAIDLQKCIQGIFPISSTPLDPNESRERFVMQLTAPYIFMDTHHENLLSSIRYLLSTTERYEFYHFWDKYTKRYKKKNDRHVVLAMSFIENEVGNKLKYPYDTDDVWNTLVTKASNNAKKLQILNKNVAISIDKWPQIEFLCKEESGEKTIQLPRHKLVELISKPADLMKDSFDKYKYEFIFPPNIRTSIKKHTKTFFEYEENGNYYKIKLGHYLRDEKQQLWTKFGIQETRSYSWHARSVSRQVDADDESRLYIFDRDNCIQAAIAIKEIAGEKCPVERLHSLLYYCYQPMWDKLTEKLYFFIDFASHTGLAIDYSELAFQLFDYAKENKIEKLFEILEGVFIFLTENRDKYLYKTIRRANEALHDIKTLQHNTLCFDEESPCSEEEKEAKKMELLKERFRYAQAAGMLVSNYYLAEISGCQLGERFAKDDVSKNPTDVIVELVAKNKELSTEIKVLKEKIAQLEQQNTNAPTQTEKVSFFSSLHL